MFGWCSSGQHSLCKREYQRFIIDPKTSRVVWLDETRYCQCPKRSCKCYVPAKDREKKRRSRRKS